jgi:hypothetical protein
MSPYSYAECLRTAYRVNWRISDVLGDKAFDPSRRWLPASLSGAGSITCLDEDERRKLTHVEMAAYAHLFAYVEEFIAPTANALAQDFQVEGREAFDALTNFAAEEVKHMNLFRQVRARVNAALGFETELLGGQAATARFVMSKSRGAVLLLTAAIEWFTQRHFQEAFRDDAGLDPLTVDVFRAHWQEECQHAKLDHLETLRAFRGMDDAARDRAVDDLIELVAAVRGLVETQTGHDLANLETYLGRRLDTEERAEVAEHVLRAKVWTFLESGTTHERFLELFAAVTTPSQQERVAAALGTVLTVAPRWARTAAAPAGSGTA